MLRTLTTRGFRYIVHCINVALHHFTEVRTMMNRIEKFADNLKSESNQLAGRAIAALRAAGLETAGLIARTKGPVNTFGETGLKLNNLSHKSIEKLLKQQVSALEDLIDGSADRLKMAAKADDVQSLIEGQVSSLPKTRDMAVSNAKKTVSIMRDTGDAFGDLFKDAVVDISSARPGTRKKAPAKKRATRKTTAKKAGSKKASAKKAPAKKRTTRKASAKKASTKKTTAQAA